MTIVQPQARPGHAEPVPKEPSEGAPKSDGPDPGQEQAGLYVIQELREQALELVRCLDGPVRRVSLSAGSCTVEVEWARPAPEPAPMPSPMPPAAAVSSAPAGQPQGPEPAPAASPVDAAGEPAHTINAPLVGTFYRSPEPGAEPFVSVGDVVEPGQTLAIVEAMKLMNPITCDLRARVTAAHPADGEMVEYGQPLFDLVPLADED